MHLVVKAMSNKSTRDRTLTKLLKSTAMKASGISKIFLSEIPNELCDRLKLIIQEKKVGINPDLINEEIVAIADKLLEYNPISTKQHKFLQLKCLN